MLSYYVIYCEKFRKVLQRTEKLALRFCVLLQRSGTQSVIRDNTVYGKVLQLTDCYLKPHSHNLGSFGPGKKKCRQFAICNLQFC